MPHNIRKKMLSALVYLFFALSIYLSYIIFKNLSINETKRDVTILIKSDSTIKQALSIFDDSILERSPQLLNMAYNIYSFIFKKHLASGYHSIPVGSTPLTIFKILSSIETAYLPITIPEGITTYQAITLIKEGYQKAQAIWPECNAVNAESFASSLSASKGLLQEGKLMPSTYFIGCRTKVGSLISRMRKLMNDSLGKMWVDRDKSIDACIHSPYEALILASIVEKETSLSKERGIIAGIYLARLKINMRLQSDPSVIYGITEGKKSLSRQLFHSDLYNMENHYNTYRYNGLPPSPICNPGTESIMAVLHPVWSEYLFFVMNNRGEHIFSKNYDEHLNARAMLRDQSQKTEASDIEEGSLLIEENK